MPVTNPWLAGPAPTARLERPRLEERLLNLLSSQNMCVLATPVRYFHLDFTLPPATPSPRKLGPWPRS